MNLNAALPMGEKFDLAMSLEVAEHLKPATAPQFVNSLATASDAVLFSAAYSNQGGTNHFNEQPQTYWARLFAEDNFAPFDLFRPAFWGNDHVCFWYRRPVEPNNGTGMSGNSRYQLYELYSPRPL